MDRPYTVALREAQDLPSAERIAAELRFIRELEKALGSADQVVTAYRAWTDAVESDVVTLDSATALLATTWPKASDRARLAGFKGIGDIGEAQFEVHLPRQAASAS